MNTQSTYERLKKINKVLTILVFVFAAYLILDPLVPEAVYQFKKLEHSMVKPAMAAESIATPDLSYNHLIIPKIFVDTKIIEAKSVWEIHESLWRRPNTSTFPEGGNTTVIGHRFANLNTPWHESVFYNLPKLEKGDRATAVWNGKLYTYEVFEKKIVPPTDVRVEFNTPNPILTLFTCTLDGKQRIVVVMKLVETNDTNLAKQIVK